MSKYFIIFLLCIQIATADYYVLEGSSGDGSSWNDAYGCLRILREAAHITSLTEHTQVMILTILSLPANMNAGTHIGPAKTWLDDVEIWTRIPGQADCIHQADNSPCDGKVSISELSAYIDRWKTGQHTLADVMGAVLAWEG